MKIHTLRAELRYGRYEKNKPRFLTSRNSQFYWGQYDNTHENDEAVNKFKVIGIWADNTR